MIWCIIIFILIIAAILIFGAYKCFAKGDDVTGTFLCTVAVGCIVWFPPIMLSRPSGEDIATCKEYWVDDIVTYSGDSIIDITYRIHYKY